MAITRHRGHGYQAAAFVDFTYDNFTSGTAEVAIDLPDNSIVAGGFIVIDTAFNSATSDTLTVGDALDDDRYATGVDGQAAALTALTLTGYTHTTTKQITIKWTGVGTAPTAGAGRLVVEYVMNDKADFNVDAL